MDTASFYLPSTDAAADIGFRKRDIGPSCQPVIFLPNVNPPCPRSRVPAGAERECAGRDEEETARCAEAVEGETALCAPSVEEETFCCASVAEEPTAVAKGELARRTAEVAR